MSDHFGNISIEPEQPSPTSVKKRARRRPAKPKPQKAPAGIPVFLIPAGVTLLLAVLYCAAGFWGVPHYLTNSLPERFFQQTGMQMTIQSARFNPFTFELTLADIAVRTAEEIDTREAEILAINSFMIDLAPLSLLRTDLVCTRLQAEGLVLRAIRNARGQYNIARFFSEVDQSQPSEFMNFSELPFLFSLNNISVSKSTILFRDIPGNTSHTIEEFELALPNLSNFPFQASEYIHPSFSAVINGSPIELTGQAAIGSEGTAGSQLETKLACSFHAIDLPHYFNYLPMPSPLNITKGKADGTLQLTFSPGSKTEKLSVGFEITTSGLEMTDRRNMLKSHIPSARFEGAIQPVTGDTYLKNIVLRKPTLQVTDQRSLNSLTKIISPNTSPDTEGTQVKPPALIIDLLIADGGTFTILNDKTKKTLDSWESIQLSVKDFARNTDNVKTTPGTFRLTAEQSNSQASLNWQGRMHQGELAEGQVRIDNLGAAILFDWLSLSSLGQSAGSADIQAMLAIGTSQDKEKTLLRLTDGTLTFHDLTLKQGKDTWFTAPVTKFTDFSTSGSQISLGDIHLLNSAVNLQINDLPKIFKDVAAAKNNICLQGLEFSGNITIKDATTTQPALVFTEAALQAINLHTKHQDSAAENLTFKVKLAETGILQAKGTVSLRPFNAFLTTGFSGIDATKLLPWFGSNTLLTTTTAKLGGKGTFTYPEVSFNGQVQLLDGNLTDRKESYFSWQSLDLQGFRYTHTPLHIGIIDVFLQQPQLRFEHQAADPHVLEMFTSYMAKHFPCPEDGKTSTNTSISLTPLEIQKIDIKEGSIHYTDSRLEPAWKADITGVAGYIDGLYAKGSADTSDFTFRGELDSLPFSLEGSLNFFDINVPGNTKFFLADYPLAAFHEQLLPQIDIDSSRGSFALELQSSWQDNTLRDQAGFRFTHVEPISEKAETALPLALLTNTQQEFELTVTKERKLGTNDSALFADTLTTFQRMMVKADVSPLLLTTGDFTDLIGREYADFLPGQLVLSGQGREALARYSALLSAHPNVGLTITGSADSIVDGESLKKQLEETEQQRVAKENSRRAAAWQQARESKLQELTAARSQGGKQPAIIEQEIPADQLNIYGPVTPAPVLIDATMLKEIAGQRAQAIRNIFVSQLALQPDRIKIAEQVRITDGVQEPGNRIHFSLNTYTGATAKNSTTEAQPGKSANEAGAPAASSEE